MKSYFSICGLLLMGAIDQASSQISKPAIDIAVLDKWPSSGSDGQLNSNGKYLYMHSPAINKQGDVHTFKSTVNNWSKEYKGISNVTFSLDGNYALYTKKDVLFFLKLGTDKCDSIIHIESHEIIRSGANEWLIYRLKEDKDSALHILHTVNKKEIILPAVRSYSFFPSGKSLILTRPDNMAKRTSQSTVSWYNLEKHTFTPAFTADLSMLSSLIICKTAESICFAEKDTSGNVSRLWFYTRGMTAPAILLTHEDIQKIDTSLALEEEGWLQFTGDGQHICFRVKEKNIQMPVKNAAKVTIWRYEDPLLPTEQRIDSKEYLWMVSVTDKKIAPVQSLFGSIQTDLTECNKYMVCRKLGFTGSNFWQQGAGNTISSVSIKNGAATIIQAKVPYSTLYFLSPEEKYVVYYDPLQRNYFCFTTATGFTRNITAGIPVRWTAGDSTAAILNWTHSEGIAGWLPNDEAVLIYADYDIWKVDLKGVETPVNITNGFGENNHICLRLLEQSVPTYGGKSTTTLSPDKELLLYAFDSATKRSGFYVKKMNTTGDPQLLSMEDYSYEAGRIQKAEKANKWIIPRENATHARNLFLTSDFKYFSPLTNSNPQQNYNWLTDELVTWQLPNGANNQGILYKPENFDSTKKYPVIFDYYEQRSDELNHYIAPRFCTDRINIPYFVSNGYLVFVPDIHYAIGHAGESALNAVVSAARYLSQKPWIDSSRMGIQGHSFGGFETNYIITHSRLFAAACEAAGPSDAVSEYGMLPAHGRGTWFDGAFHQHYEGYQGRIHASLAENPGLYIQESPVFNTAAVTTPLLMMHNRADISVSWIQAGEFFTGLRRMGKRVWMLEYEDAGHSIFGVQAKDYTIRMMQFFDNYLKDAACPQWMLQEGGDGYELDRNGKEPEQKEVLYKGKFQKVNEKKIYN